MSSTSSDLPDGYETVVACPIIDPDDNEGDIPGCLEASLRSPCTGQMNASPGTSKHLKCSDKETSQKSSGRTSKALRPQTVAQRECKPANKRKHDQAFEQQPWHPARSVLERISGTELYSNRDIAHDVSLRSGLQRPFNEVCSSVTKMLCQGQSTSLAVIGPQGVGKSLVCQHAAAYSIKASGLPCASVATIHLSGSLHREEIRALRYIARELCQFCGFKFNSSASVDDNIKFLETMMQHMSSLYREKKSLIFVLDDLAHFLQECKSRVLYTLLDLLQRANVQTVVIGISCMTSVLDLMEKRARSRFSHKVVVVHAPSSNACSEAKDTPAAVLASMLQLRAVGDSKASESESTKHAVATWNEGMNVALADDQVKAAVEYLSFCGVSYSRLQDICRSFCCKVLMEITLQRIKACEALSTTQLLREAVEQIVCAEDPIQDILLDCSTLQIQVIQAALRLKQEARQLSFQSIAAEYSNPRTNSEAGLKYAEPAIWAAFQSLKQKDVLFVVGRSNTARVSQARQQVDLSISSADMRLFG